ncbi:MAG TPA: AbrB family transcriptional regulator [Pseudolabrys sp.]|nr:AbrB family transcriptional regulator [Pseudolabrys sp.]
MPASPTLFPLIGRTVETLVLAAVGGVALGLTGVPGGYLSGAILTVSAAALAGRPMLVPVPLMRTIFVLLGISLGSVMTPEMLHGMAKYPLSIAVLLVAMACIGLACAAYLQVVHKWDRISAYLASAPGGMSQVLAVAAEVGGDLRAIAIVQSMRVVIIAVGLPSGLSLLGLASHVSRPLGSPMTWASLDEFGMLAAAAVAGAIAFHKLRFPGGLLFGAMFASGALHATEIVHFVLPWWATNTAAIALGGIIGARFANMSLRLFAHFIGAAFGSFAVAVTIATAFGAVIIRMMTLPVPEVMMAFAPGSVDAMMLLALALHLDPVYVGAHHVVRIFFVALATPFMVRREAGKPKRTAATEVPEAMQAPMDE